MNRLFSLNTTRSLIRCSGAKIETSQFLQGLITNDMNHLVQDNSCIYTLFLNKAGRVLYDSIVYKTPVTDDSKEGFLIECDASVVNSLTKHLKLYRVRRKIEIALSEDHDVWCFQGSTELLKSSKDLKICTDPRLKEIGSRIISPKDQNLKNFLKESLLEVQEASNEDYVAHRYKFGICEGVIDLPPEKALPLESNCDYMHGVSFHKGCYIGQELTARTHHTGVIRKRLMPVFFEKEITFKADEVNDVKDEENKSIGKIRNIVGQYGLGLLRIEQVMAAKQLCLNENKCRTERPSWWPVEAEKTPRITRT